MALATSPPRARAPRWVWQQQQRPRWGCLLARHHDGGEATLPGGNRVLPGWLAGWLAGWLPPIAWLQTASASQPSCRPLWYPRRSACRL
jgi:hypothetical protein